jgi:hypothetical protein
MTNITRAKTDNSAVQPVDTTIKRKLHLSAEERDPWLRKKGGLNKY